MRTLVYICAITIFIAVLIPMAPARVLGSDLENVVAVYYFNALTDSGNVRDYSGNGLQGRLYGGAALATVSDRDCLSMDSHAANLQAWDDNQPLSLSREFSIVAWVQLPQQLNSFLIEIYTYNRSIAHIKRNVYAGSEGSVTFGVLRNGALFGSYAYNNNATSHSAQSTGRNIGYNRWQHIGFVINDTSIKLYLNGIRITDQAVRGHEALAGSGSFISIGDNTRGNVDDVGFFKNDLTDAQVQMIYNHGLENIINIAAVDPGGKVATTWGALKQK